MGLFGRRDDYDRTRLLREARDAQRKGKHKRALACLRRVLVVEPNSAELHGLIASSLAERGLEFSAWESYQRSALSCYRDGKKQLALDLYRDATKRMPRHYEAWKARAALERRLSRAVDAKRTLEAALEHFRTRAMRHPLIALLRQLLEVDPNNIDAKLELAFVLSKTGQKDEALLLLSKLAKVSDTCALRRVRGSQWRIEPSVLHSWRWFRATVSS